MPFKIKILYSAIITLLSCNSCCYSVDSTVPPGYPFSGHTQELGYTVHSMLYPFSLFSYNPDYKVFDTSYIRDSVQFSAFFNKPSNVDFNTYDLALVQGFIDYLHKSTFQKRILIDHHSRTYTIELRAEGGICRGDGIGPEYNYLGEFLLIPKVPEGYTFSVQRFAPVGPN